MTAYRTAAETRKVLDVSCRKCGAWGLERAYHPDVKPDAGPLCKRCFTEWRGVSKMDYAVIGVRETMYPTKMRDLPTYKTVTVPGDWAYESPWLDDDPFVIANKPKPPEAPKLSWRCRIGWHSWHRYSTTQRPASGPGVDYVDHCICRRCGKPIRFIW